jgi:hypothetical protein
MLTHVKTGASLNGGRIVRSLDLRCSKADHNDR